MYERNTAANEDLVDIRNMKTNKTKDKEDRRREGEAREANEEELRFICSLHLKSLEILNYRYLAAT